MEAKMKEILFTFVCVTTLVVFATAIYITVFWNDPELKVDVLWQILGTSALCSLGNLIYTQKEVSKKYLIMRILIHYAYINVIVLGCGITFGWFLLEQMPMVVGMVILIAIVFAIIWGVIKYRDSQLAKRFNERLEEYNDRQ